MKTKHTRVGNTSMIKSCYRVEFSNLATSGAGNADAENGVSPTENCVRARIEVGGYRSSEISFRGLVGNQQ
jgi:hypothetical protein